MKWFSCKLRMVVLLEKQGATRHADSVFLFRAEDFDAAFQRALELGRAEEDDYIGGEGEKVRWRLKEIISLDILGEELDGAEVYSEPVALAAGETYNFDASFEPEKSKPTQTV
jgi:hypothetical protein